MPIIPSTQPEVGFMRRVVLWLEGDTAAEPSAERQDQIIPVRLTQAQPTVLSQTQAEIACFTLRQPTYTPLSTFTRPHSPQQ